MIKDIKVKESLICLLILLLGVLGGILGNRTLLLALVPTVLATIAYIVIGRFSRKYYIPFLACTSLAFLYQISLLTPYLIGTDIHSEFFFLWNFQQIGYWDTTLAHPYNAAILLDLVVPSIATFLHIPLMVVVKVFIPIWFTLTPILAYLMLSRVLKARTLAFLSALLLILMPAYFMEVNMTLRQSLAEPFFVLSLWLLIDSSLIKTTWKRLICLAVSVLITIMGHYSLGGVLLLLISLYLIFMALRFTWKRSIPIPLWRTSLVLLLVTILGFTYLNTVAGGSTITFMKAVLDPSIVALGSAEEGYQYIEDGNSTGWENLEHSMVYNPDLLGKVGVGVFQKLKSGDLSGYLEDHEELLKVGLGLDFLEVGIKGKVFRFVQFLLEGLLVIGAVLLLRKKKVPTTYRTLVLAVVGVLGLCILVPSFSATINASRYLHLALIVLAPICILPFFLLSKRKAYILFFLIFLAPYVIVTSGFLFEALGSTEPKASILPYNYALSGKRLNLLGDYTENDYLMRDYILDQEQVPVYSDLQSTLLLQEHSGLSRKVRIIFSPQYIGELKKYAPFYIYLRDWNGKAQKLQIWSGVGSRDFPSLGSYKEILGNSTLIKAYGDSQLYYYPGEQN